MSCFLYFLPGAPAVVSSLKPWGLVQFDGPLSSRQVTTPMASGTIVANTDQSQLCAFDGDRQTWRKIPSRFALMDAWIGYWNDNRPTAKTLAKPKQLDGETVKLLDGHDWIVPKLREYAETDSAKLVYHQRLPSLLDYSEEGNLIIGDVVPQYREVWEKSLAIGDALLGSDHEGTVSLAEQFEFAGPVLGINYYVSMFELTTLGIIGGEEAKAIVRAALDINSLEERIKNVLSHRNSGGTNSTTGSAA